MTGHFLKFPKYLGKDHPLAKHETSSSSVPAKTTPTTRRPAELSTSNNKHLNNTTTTHAITATIIIVIQMPGAFSVPRNTLRSNLPRAGFVWPDRASLLALGGQDTAVRVALREHGGIASLQGGARGSARRDVEQAFVAIFAKARADALAGRVKQFDTALDWVADLRGRSSWGGFIDEDLFIDLFLRIGRARQDWHMSPREPFNTEEHGPLAHAIDAFYSVVSSDWLDADEELFRGVLPPAVELAREVKVRSRRVDVDAVAVAPRTQGTGTSTAVGEPRTQRQTTVGGVKDKEDIENEVDEDIEMGEGEVEEVCKRLDRAEIQGGDEQDEDVEMEG